METFYLHGLLMPPRKCLYAEGKCIPVISSKQNAGLLSAECALSQKDFITGLFWTAGRAFPGGEDEHPGCVSHLSKLLLEGEGSVYEQGWGAFLNVQKYSLILKGRGARNSFRLPCEIFGSVANLWMMNCGPCFKHTRQKFLSFCKL